MAENRIDWRKTIHIPARMICKTLFPIAACMFLSLCAATRTVKSQKFGIHLNTQLKENGTHFKKSTKDSL